jgi:hypothetical protein
MVVWIVLSPDLRARSYIVGSEAMAHPFATACRSEVLSKEDVDCIFVFVKWEGVCCYPGGLLPINKLHPLVMCPSPCHPRVVRHVMFKELVGFLDADLDSAKQCKGMDTPKPIQHFALHGFHISKDFA